MKRIVSSKKQTNNYFKEHKLFAENNYTVKKKANYKGNTST